VSADLLLFLHLAGAFLFVGGALAAGALRIEAMRRRHPGEIALLLRAVRPLVAAIGTGLLFAVAFGSALAHRLGYPFGSSWLVATYALLVWIVLAGGAAGREDRRTRELAEALAVENDTSIRELTTRLRDPLNLTLNASLLLAVLGIVALMVWRP
jgi:uncharacterized membrane protein